MSRLANPEAEAALLGMYLTVRGALSRYPVRDTAFQTPTHRAIYEAVKAVETAGETPDFATVAAEMTRTRSHVSGEVLFQICEQAPPTLTPSVHAAVIEAQQRRTLHEAAQALAQRAQDPETPPREALDAHHAFMAQELATGGTDDAGWVLDDIAALLERRERVQYVPTGLTDVDFVLGGWPIGAMSVVAARAGVGKSAFAIHCALHAVRSGRKVLFCSAELSRAEVAARVAAHASGVSARRMLLEQLDDATVDHVARRTATAQPVMRVYAPARTTVHDVSDVLARIAAREHVDLVVVDHLHHLAVDGAHAKLARHEQLRHMVHGFTSLAKQYGVALVLLAQLNRDGDEAPRSRNLRDSGAIEELANNVMLLHRDEARPEMMQLILDKNRHGERKRIEVHFDGSTGRFSDVDVL